MFNLSFACLILLLFLLLFVLMKRYLGRKRTSFNMFVKLFLFSGIFSSLLTGTYRSGRLIFCLMDYLMRLLFFGCLF